MDSTQATPDVVKSIEADMTEQVKSLRDGHFSDTDLERAKQYLIGKHALSHERIRDRAHYLGWSETMGMGYQSDLPVCYGESMVRVTKADVIRACARYLSDPTTLVYLGESGKQQNAK